MSFPRLPLLAATAAVSALLAGCGTDTATSGDELRVVTSIYPLEYVVERIAGEHADISTLTSPGQEPHDLELGIEQTAQLEDADLVVYGSGLQPAVDEGVETSGPERVVDAAEVAGASAEDPHYWLDPANLVAVGSQVRDQLVALDDDNRDDYERGFEELRRDLEQLDRDFEEGLAGCRVDTVVVSHDAFQAWTKYGLEFASVSGRSPEAEPSPARIAELHDLVRQEGITTVFAERLGSSTYVDALADDLGLRTDVLDPVEGLGEETADEDYLTLMRDNLAALRKANQCR